MRRLWPILLLLGACARLPEPSAVLFVPPEFPGVEIRGAERFRPSAHIKELYRRTEECAGIKGDFRKIRWYLTDSMEYVPMHLPYVGYYDEGKIFILRPYADIDWVYMHETMHDLLFIAGIKANHPPEYFLTCIKPS